MSAEFGKIVLEKFDDLNSKITGLSEEVHELKEKVNNLSKDVCDTQDILKIQSQNLAHFEHNCMLKLNTLFDSFMANSEEHARF